MFGDEAEAPLPTDCDEAAALLPADCDEAEASPPVDLVKLQLEEVLPSLAPADLVGI